MILTFSDLHLGHKYGMKKLHEIEKVFSHFEKEELEMVMLLGDIIEGNLSVKGMEANSNNCK